MSVVVIALRWFDPPFPLRVTACRLCMSALPLKADIQTAGQHVRLVPIADVNGIAALDSAGMKLDIVQLLLGPHEDRKYGPLSRN